MSGFTSFASAAGANQNLDNTYEFIGFSTGAGTSVAAAGSTNTKGSYVQLAAGGVGGVTENALRGIFVQADAASAASARFLMDLSFDGGSTVAIPNIFLQPGTPVYGASPGYYFPMAIAAGANIQARVQSATASASLPVAITGVISNAQSPPCFATCDAINAASTGDSLPASTNVPLTDAWTELAASTAATYGAIAAIAGFNGTLPGTSQPVGLQIGTGAAAAEAAIMRWIAAAHTASPALRNAVSPLIEKTIASGTRLSAKAYGGTPLTDNFRIQLFGFR